MPQLIHLPEPKLRFGFEQAVEDPRDGLMLFGPLEQAKPYGIRSGVIGTSQSIDLFKKWVKKIQCPVNDKNPSEARPPFPGFEAVFGIPWSPTPTLEVTIPSRELDETIRIDDAHIRVYRTVELFEKRIIESIRNEDVDIDVWFVIIPDSVYQFGRPKSVVPVAEQIKVSSRLSPSKARKLLVQSTMFQEDRDAAEPYYYDVHFHNQLKARLLNYNVVTQIIRESTLIQEDWSHRVNELPRGNDNTQTAIAWNLSTTAFYKTGGKPWKLANVRKGVCYIGLVFKQDTRNADPRSACCAAQMFLDSGDGVVFKGALGPWYKMKKSDFHLSTKAAYELVSTAMSSYKERVGSLPSELFIHGKIRLDDEDEWNGFKDAAGLNTNIVGVRIREDNELKLYRLMEYPVLRGMAYVKDDKTAYLWSKGFVPRLKTYVGREVPWPLSIEICRGDADINTILNDILALTKLNYNTCIYADGVPVTLRFADAVGEILTAGPTDKTPPLTFKHYI